MPTVQPPKRIYRTFPKIGRGVNFLYTKEGNPRNGEGAFLRLKNGDILHAYTAYDGNDYHDNCHANICGVYSADEGETWSAPRVLLRRPEDAENLMSVSLLRMKNGDIGLFCIRKELYEGAVIYRYQVARSSDEGETWSEPVDCIEVRNRYIVLNDTVRRLRDGSIFFPSSLHDYKNPEGGTEGFDAGKVTFFRSTDDGAHFERIPVWLRSPIPGDTTGLQEPGVHELPDGTLWAWARTRLGCQYASYSKDGGQTWSDPAPDFRFTSPRAPMRVSNVGQFTVAVFNPVPEHAANPAPFGMDRTPLMVSVSEDGGVTFPRSYLLEDDPSCAYCYPAIIGVEGGFLVAYYHSNHTGKYLNCGKIAKISFKEIEA